MLCIFSPSVTQAGLLGYDAFYVSTDNTCLFVGGESCAGLQTIGNSKEIFVLTTVNLTLVSLKGSAETTQLAGIKTKGSFEEIFSPAGRETFEMSVSLALKLCVSQLVAKFVCLLLDFGWGACNG